MAGVEVGAASMLSEHATLLQPTRGHNLEAFSTLPLWDFVKAPGHGHDGLNHWPPVMELHLQAVAPLPGGQSSD